MGLAALALVLLISGGLLGCLLLNPTTLQVSTATAEVTADRNVHVDEGANHVWCVAGDPGLTVPAVRTTGDRDSLRLDVASLPCVGSPRAMALEVSPRLVAARPPVTCRSGRDLLNDQVVART